MATINWQDISSFDYIFAGILAFFLLRGLCAGFLRQLAAVAALLGSGWLAGAYSMQLMPLAADYLPPPEQLVIRPAVVFWFSYSCLYLLIRFVFILIGLLLEVKRIGWGDRMAGGLLGLARGAFVTVLLFLLLAAVVPIGHPIYAGSLAAPYLSQGAEIVRQFVRDAKIREDIRPLPPQETEQPPKPAEKEIPPPPADGTMVLPDDAIPDHGEAQLPPTGPEQEELDREQEQSVPAEN